MAYLPSAYPQASLLHLIVDRLRKLNMSDWIKIGLTLAGFAIVTWSSVQNLQYRVDKIENNLESHLEKHDAQNREIIRSLQDMELQLTRLQK